jgi:ubiquinone/menaquinone biosynthesis C-methylase UbiE
LDLLEEKVLRPIRRYVRAVKRRVQSWWLFRKAAPTAEQSAWQKSDGYQDYLKRQLRRTLRKKETQRSHTSRLIDQTADLVDLGQCRVLCVGCRNMTEINYFRGKNVRSVTGIDLYSSDPAIQVMDMHAMTFLPDSFDVIYASHSLEHSYDARKVAGEITRVGRAGGLVVVEVPVNYPTNEIDMVDFHDLQTLQATFEPHVGRVLWSEQVFPTSSDSVHNSEIIRIIFQIQKSI